jgi:hypothetical protein
LLSTVNRLDGSPRDGTTEAIKIVQAGRSELRDQHVYEARHASSMPRAASGPPNSVRTQPGAILEAKAIAISSNVGDPNVALPAVPTPAKLAPLSAE